jgi:hypothetical protein
MIQFLKRMEKVFKVDRAVAFLFFHGNERQVTMQPRRKQG